MDPIALPPVDASHCTIGGVDIIIGGPPGAAWLSWTAGLAIDADGAPNAYAPLNSGLPALDNLRNAWIPGRFCELVLDHSGDPHIQGSDDPFPGYYVCGTALVDRSYPPTSPNRYVNANKVPYISIPPELRDLGAQVGDVARVSWRAGRWCQAIVADIGPHGKIGEGSIALARQLGIDPSPVHGGTGAGVSVQLWLGSSRGWPRTQDSITAQVVELFTVPVG